MAWRCQFHLFLPHLPIFPCLRRGARRPLPPAPSPKGKGEGWTIWNWRSQFADTWFCRGTGRSPLFRYSDQQETRSENQSSIMHRKLMTISSHKGTEKIRSSPRNVGAETLSPRESSPKGFRVSTLVFRLEEQSPKTGWRYGLAMSTCQISRGDRPVAHSNVGNAAARDLSPRPPRTKLSAFSR